MASLVGISRLLSFPLKNCCSGPMNGVAVVAGMDTVHGPNSMGSCSPRLVQLPPLPIIQLTTH